MPLILSSNISPITLGRGKNILIHSTRPFNIYFFYKYATVEIRGNKYETNRDIREIYSNMYYGYSEEWSITLINVAIQQPRTILFCLLSSI